MQALNPKRWLHDRRLANECEHLIGVDEVGRGCLAGPVVASAVRIDRAFFSSRKRRKVCLEMRDSKQLTADRRVALVEAMSEWEGAGLMRIAIAEGSVAEIEHLNILEANTLAMRRALMNLVPQSLDWEAADAPRILVDGRPVKRLGYPHQAIVKGDDTSLVIAMASIAAKVHRDRLMVAAESQFPGYDFAENKGYGTEKHRIALKRIGPTALHRMSFLQKILGGSACTAQSELPL